MEAGDSDPKSQRLSAGDTVGLEREGGDWMKGAVVSVSGDAVDVVVDGSVVEGEVLSVSRTVRDDARYTAVMEVVESSPGRTRVRLVGDWRRVQLRRFVRVSVFGVRVDVDDEQGCRLIDLSAGGLRFETRQEHPTGEILELRFGLGHHGPVSVRGEIVRLVGRRDGETGPYQYGVRFVQLDEAVRVKIMTWVVTEQSRRFREKKAEGQA